MKTESCYQLNTGVLVDHICGLDLMISTCSKEKKNSYLVLNDDSLFLVNHIQAGESLESIIQAVMQQFQVNYQQAKETIERFLETLITLGYIREETPS